MPNRNARTGREAEEIFIATLGSHPEVVRELLRAFGLASVFRLAEKSNDKFIEIRFENDRGVRSLYANLMSYNKVGSNQTTRMAVDMFAKKYGLTDTQLEELREMILIKGEWPRKLMLFPYEQQERWKEIIAPRAARIIENSISNGYPRREIFVLFDRPAEKIQIWKMAEILEAMGNRIGFTNGGNMSLGTCFELQRKGGDGNSNKDPDDPKHPANHIQIKINVGKFLRNHENLMLARYSI